jgi:hypothetical protein
MGLFIMEISNTTKFLVKENMYGQMEKPMMVSGRKIKCMALGYLFGKMVKNMKEIS